MDPAAMDAIRAAAAPLRAEFEPSPDPPPTNLPL
jgi:hypothetical protein